MTKEKLSEYKKKRDFGKTPEPSGKGGGRKKGERIFVIQKHEATRLHYDFRLEIDGVLKSWAVPKGPSTDPRDKRLAVLTEDHPIEYAEFEGVIPKGEYGGGTVMVWDYGAYENLREHKDKPTSMMESFDEGQIEIDLKGKKLTGGYVLRRFRGEKKQWLLIKMRDAGADARSNPVDSKPKSAKSGRTLKQIANQAGQKVVSK